MVPSREKRLAAVLSVKRLIEQRVPPISALKFAAKHFGITIRMLSFDAGTIPEIAARAYAIRTEEKVKRAQKKARAFKKAKRVSLAKKGRLDSPKNR